jgi:hypothetical protein
MISKFNTVHVLVLEYTVVDAVRTLVATKHAAHSWVQSQSRFKLKSAGCGEPVMPRLMIRSSFFLPMVAVLDVVIRVCAPIQAFSRKTKDTIIRK